MKQYVVASILLSLFVIPGISLAASDVDTSASASCANLTQNLRYRSTDAQTGGSVSVLQDFLSANAYLSGQPTGFFGSLTRSAVISFQNANNLSATPPGFVGSLTRAKIKSIDCDGAPSTTVTIPTVSSTATLTGCAGGAMYNSTTGQLCVATTITPQTTTYQPLSVKIISPEGSPRSGSFAAGSLVNVYWNKTGTTPNNSYYFVYLKSRPDQVLGGTGSNISYTPLVFRESTLNYPSFSVTLPSDQNTIGSTPLSPGTYYLELDVANSNGDVITTATTNPLTVVASQSIGTVSPITTTTADISSYLSVSSEPQQGLASYEGYNNYVIHLRNSSSMTVESWKAYYTCSNTNVSFQNSGADCGSSSPQYLRGINYNLGIKQPSAGSGEATVNIRFDALNSAGAVIGRTNYSISLPGM